MQFKVDEELIDIGEPKKLAMRILRLMDEAGSPLEALVAVEIVKRRIEHLNDRIDSMAEAANSETSEVLHSLACIIADGLLEDVANLSPVWRSTSKKQRKKRSTE